MNNQHRPETPTRTESAPEDECTQESCRMSNCDCSCRDRMLGTGSRTGQGSGGSGESSEDSWIEFTDKLGRALMSTGNADINTKTGGVNDENEPK